MNEIVDKTRATTCTMWAVWGEEAIGVMFDLRWALVLIAVLVAVDFWWGRSESNMLYQKSKVHNDKRGMDAYRFRWSRAVRRTVNKLIDYLTFLLVGALVGLAITEHYDMLDHVQTAALGLAIAAVVEVMSIWGHVKVVRNLGRQSGTIAKVAATLIKSKSHELAEVIEEVSAESEEVKD